MDTDQTAEKQYDLDLRCLSKRHINRDFSRRQKQAIFVVIAAS